MRFLNNNYPDHDLTYNEVFMVPRRSGVASRLDVNLTSTDGLATPLPLVVANMTAISGRRMAETVARRGGIAIFPQDIPTDVVARAIARVKRSHTRFDTPVTVSAGTTLGEAMNVISKRSHNLVLVVEGDRNSGELTPLGIVTRTDAAGEDRFTLVESVMSRDLVTVPPQASAKEIFDVVSDRHVNAAVATEGDRLVGIMTRKGALRSELYAPALDAQGRLKAGAAIGINGDVAARAEQLLEAEADVLVVDTAHGHQEKMMEALEAVRRVRDAYRPDIKIVAGNVVTADGTEDLIEAGADVIKVGVGPGAMCTTRMQTGVGRPQFSAVLECAASARAAGKAIWADGGVKHPRDVALALAAGASSVMIGSWFAGTHESTGELLTDHQGRQYKESFGMASARAVRARTRDQSGFERARAGLFEEGISSARMYVDPAHPGVEDLIDYIVSGVRSSCTYAGARSLAEFSDLAVIGLQSTSGYDEGRPVHASW